MERFATQIRSRLIPALLVVFAAGVSVASETPAGGYELLVEDNLVSLHATQAPLAQVLLDLGKEAGFEVDEEIGDDVTVTLAFKQSPLDDAIEALCKPVGYLLVRDPANNRVLKVVLTPKRTYVNRTAERQAEPPGWRPKEPLPPDAPEAATPKPIDGAVDRGQEQSPLRPTEQETEKRDD